MHQRNILNMVGEFSLGWRPKTRSKNKMRVNMKKLLNPKLNTKQVTALDTSSSDEKIESNKDDYKRKSKKDDCKRKKPLKIVEESSLTETKLSTVFLELRSEMLKEQ